MKTWGGGNGRLVGRSTANSFLQAVISPGTASCEHIRASPPCLGTVLGSSCSKPNPTGRLWGKPSEGSHLWVTPHRSSPGSKGHQKEGSICKQCQAVTSLFQSRPPPQQHCHAAARLIAKCKGKRILCRTSVGWEGSRLSGILQNEKDRGICREVAGNP